MHGQARNRIPLACALMVTASVIALSGQYRITVNRDRLINAMNEPHNWPTKEKHPFFAVLADDPLASWVSPMKSKKIPQVLFNVSKRWDSPFSW